ncbi:MAG: DUF2254 domain-containing protein [Acidimicrobiaceae bacterium]|nr:DUF2254 domain-containing protein [Acidimicrobiaceae bacterium]
MRRVRDSLWFAPATAAIGAIAICILAYLIGRTWQPGISVDISEDTLITVLALFASSMLTVATFSLSAIITSASNVAASTTPRASMQVVTDARGRVAISSFVAAFVYSVISILGLVALRFGRLGRLSLFVGLIVIFTVVLVSFITWVDRVLQLGRQQHAVASLLENATRAATPSAISTFGGTAWDGVVPDGAVAVVDDRVGRVVRLDVEAAHAVAESSGARVILPLRPGDTVEPSRPVAWVIAPEPPDDDVAERLRRAVEIDRFRGPDDVRFHLVVLAETADRALSPGVNDPGTAIVVLDQLLAFFVTYRERLGEIGPTPRADVLVAPLTADELVRDAFGPIARDGASMVEVGVRLQKVLAALVRLGPPDLATAAMRMSSTALTFSRDGLLLDEHREAVLRASRG